MGMQTFFQADVAPGTPARMSIRRQMHMNCSPFATYTCTGIVPSRLLLGERGCGGTIDYNAPLCKAVQPLPPTSSTPLRTACPRTFTFRGVVLSVLCYSRAPPKFSSLRACVSEKIIGNSMLVLVINPRAPLVLNDLVPPPCQPLSSYNLLLI